VIMLFHEGVNQALSCYQRPANDIIWPA